MKGFTYIIALFFLISIVVLIVFEIVDLSNMIETYNSLKDLGTADSILNEYIFSIGKTIVTIVCEFSGLIVAGKLIFLHTYDDGKEF